MAHNSFPVQFLTSNYAPLHCQMLLIRSYAKNPYKSKSNSDQKQNLIQVNETSRKSKIQNFAYSIHFSFSFQQESSQSHAIGVLLGASWPFSMGIGIASPTPLKFNDSNFKLHSHMMLTGRESRVNRTHKMISAAAFAHKVWKRQDNSNPPLSVVPIHNMMSQGHHQH